MCGIVGFLTKKNFDYEKIIKIMSDSIMHRGPDSYGDYKDLDKGVFLGFRRLAIIDLSDNASQPIHSFDQRFTMVFNGEIYNFSELKKIILNISKSSINFKSHSDSEVLVNTFAILGLRETLDLVSGQFSICLYDKKLKKFYLIRDRFGEKPMYYGFVNSSLVFASELKAIELFPNFNKKISEKALNYYLKFMNVPNELSIYENVYKVLPSQVIEIDLNNLQNNNYREIIKKYKFWNIIEESKLTSNSKKISRNKIYDLTESYLRKSISEQSYADVPIGSFLSGGIDSSLIASLYQTQSQNKINTFTIGFENNKFDESIYANQIASILNTNHTNITLKGLDAISIIEKIPKAYCEPFADSSQIPTLLLCNNVKKHTTVALSGDGGDELFGGYNRHIWIKKVWLIINLFPKKIRNYLSSLILSISEDAFDYIFQILKKITFKLLNFTFAGQKMHRIAYRLKYVNSLDELYIFITSEWMDYENVLKNNKLFSNDLSKIDLDFLNSFEDKMMFFDTINYLPNDILVKTDRASMFNSLEIRSPFLNKDLFLLSRQIPKDFKIQKNEGKKILKDILAKYIPQELINRPKQGFSIPLDIWLKSSLKDWAEDLLSPASLKQHEFFNEKIIINKWNEHKTSKRNWGQSLWVILMFQQWFKYYN